MHPPRTHTSRTRDIALYGALAALTLLLTFALRYPSLLEPRWYGDEGIFAAIAQNMRDGRTLYSQAWDNKPPLIFFTYAAIQSLFGTGVFPLHMVTTVAVMLTQGAVIALAFAVFGAPRAVVAGAIFAMIMGTPVIEANLAMTETYMILPASLAALVFVLAQRRAEEQRGALYVLAGLLLGVAAGYKQVAVFDGAAIGLMIWYTHERPWRAIAPLAAGFALPQLALAGLFFADGAFAGYWYAVVGSLGLYAGLSPENPAIRFGGYLPALLVVAWMTRRKGRGEAIGIESFPLLWLGFAVAGSVSSSFAFPHYLQQAAPALALTLATPARVEAEQRGQVMLAAAALAVTAIVSYQFAPAYHQRRQIDPVSYYRAFIDHRRGNTSDLEYAYYFDGKTATVRDVVSILKRDDAGTSVYVWGEVPWIYAAGGFANPTRYYTSFLGDVVPGAKAEIIRDLSAHPPVYIVVSDGAYATFDELTGFLRGRYTVLHEQGDWRIYRLSTATGAIQPLSADPQHPS
jgi:hypothetical protein